ncbi:MAG: flagellar motor switch phosphatase FliY [Lachnospiraceae bacterium]
MDGLLSQEEINALFNTTDDDVEAGTSTASDLLSPEEADAIGEISNISMGTSATTLSALVSQKVDISTPKVSVTTWDHLVDKYDKPCIFIQIRYKEGLDGNNILILKEKDVKVITDLMMGGDGSNTEGEITELHLSAIGEAMNQMMGSASTSISSMLETKVDISPPDANVIDVNTVEDAGKIAPFLQHEFVKVSFRMEIGNLVDSELMQLYPIDFAKNLYRKFTGGGEPEPEPQPAPQPTPPPVQPTPQPMQQQGMPQQGMPQMQMPPQGMPQMAPQGMPMMQGYPSPQYMPPVQDVNVAPAQFQPFMQMQSPLLKQENIDLLLDVPLEVTVELGRTSKSIREILDFAPGTVVELNRLAGEPIDVLVNGKYVAKGEVVVIAEAFGIRITDVIK